MILTVFAIGAVAVRAQFTVKIPTTTKDERMIDRKLQGATR